MTVDHALPTHSLSALGGVPSAPLPAVTGRGCCHAMPSGAFWRTRAWCKTQHKPSCALFMPAVCTIPTVRGRRFCLLTIYCMASSQVLTVMGIANASGLFLLPVQHHAWFWFLLFKKKKSYLCLHAPSPGLRFVDSWADAPPYAFPVHLYLGATTSRTSPIHILPTTCSPFHPVPF